MNDPARNALDAIAEILRKHERAEVSVLDRIEDIATDALRTEAPSVCGNREFGDGYLCTRESEHPGQHVARGLDGARIAAWGDA